MQRLGRAIFSQNLISGAECLNGNFATWRADQSACRETGRAGAWVGVLDEIHPIGRGEGRGIICPVAADLGRGLAVGRA